MANSPVDLLKDFPRRLKSVREKAGWTQQKLADKTGISRAFIALIESGRRSPSIAILEKILEVITSELGKKAWDPPKDPDKGKKTRSPIMVRKNGSATR